MRHAICLVISGMLLVLLGGCGGDDELADVDVGSATIFQAASNPATPEVLEAIVASGADVDEVDNNGLTALHYAAMSDNGPAVRILLEAQADTSITDPQGLTARDVAEMQRRSGAIQAFDRFENNR